LDASSRTKSRPQAYDPATGKYATHNRRDLIKRRPTPLAGLPSVVGAKFDVLNLQMMCRLALQEGLVISSNKYTRDYFFLTRATKM